jgi:hypothetical protein
VGSPEEPAEVAGNRVEIAFQGEMSGVEQMDLRAGQVLGEGPGAVGSEDLVVECRLFLLDRSRANKARWCSMATRGNRLKARRHYERTRTP